MVVAPRTQLKTSALRNSDPVVFMLRTRSLDLFYGRNRREPLLQSTGLRAAGEDNSGLYPLGNPILAL